MSYPADVDERHPLPRTVTYTNTKYNPPNRDATLADKCPRCNGETRQSWVTGAPVCKDWQCVNRGIVEKQETK